MAITGVHNLFYSSQPDALRTVLGDALGFESIDIGGGWLLFALPLGELAVHPSESPRHELTFFCDDLTSTVAELEAAGVEFKGDQYDEPWGTVATMVLPGDVEVLLYEPKHEVIAGG